MGQGENAFSIEDAARGLGVREIYSVDPFGDEALAALRQAKKSAGVNVVIFHAPCAVHRRRMQKGEARKRFTIDKDLCDSCTACIRLLGCPGILVTDGEYVIDGDLCDGCELCVQVCKRDAIQEVVSERV